jgi:tetratricopeptide (TPR) repeat protein
MALFPLFPDAQENLGNVHYAEGELAEARHDFERLTQLAPEFGRGWYKLGTTLIALGEETAGNEALRRAVALDPTYAAQPE